jgi:enoyl-CoA hydratase/carnithine racemase
MADTLELSRDDEGVFWITLARPERLNAMSRELIADLGEVLRGLATDRSARVVVLRGAGRAFCAGLDLKSGIDREIGGGSVPDAYEIQSAFGECVKRLHRLPQPVIAAIHGAAAGGGFSLALAADVRIAAESARMHAAFVRLGLTGGDMGSSYFLPRIVGASHAAEILLTGSTVDAAHAYRIGLVSRVVADAELESATRALAREMARNTALGLRLTKESLRLSLDSGSLDQVMAIEDRQQMLLVRTDDFREGVEAFRGKRPPRFQDA